MFFLLAICFGHMLGYHRTAGAQEPALYALNDSSSHDAKKVATTAGVRISSRAAASVELPTSLAWVREDHAGITRPRPMFIELRPDKLTRIDEQNNRVKHAAIGAGIGTGAGLLIGAAIGAHINATRPGTISATPIIAIEGAAIGFAAGLVVGALIP